MCRAQKINLDGNNSFVQLDVAKKLGDTSNEERNDGNRGLYVSDNLVSQNYVIWRSLEDKKSIEFHQGDGVTIGDGEKGGAKLSFGWCYSCCRGCTGGTNKRKNLLERRYINWLNRSKGQHRARAKVQLLESI